MKYFNTAGPVNRPEQYKLDPINRWNMPEILSLINQEKYFILHAPRQTGKTSSLLALQEYLNNEGKYFALYCNFEAGQAGRGSVDEVIGAAIAEISNRISDKELSKIIFSTITQYKGIAALNSALTRLSENSAKPVVLLIDEIDALVGDSLISVLRQIRAGYDKRPAQFPSSIVLCGVRDIKDYRIQTSGMDIITGGSAFNIKAESLRLGNFSKEDIRNLYNQHTTETGQVFTDEALDLVWLQTDGQPWLVNALANEVTSKMEENRDRSVIITEDKIEAAKNRLVVSRQTHLDQLADKLKEDRVLRVIQPMLTGEDAWPNDDDKEYCIDLGLIKKTAHGIVIANDIYREIIPRELSKEHQDNFLSRFEPLWLGKKGLIDTKVLFTMFRDFWQENGEIWSAHIKGYHEAAPHLVFQAFLQRVANGNGSILREYAIGRRRTDLMLKWRNGSELQKIVIELKIVHARQKYEKIKDLAIKQTADYANRSGSTEAHLLFFDRDNLMGWQNQPINEIVTFEGVTIDLWGI